MESNKNVGLYIGITVALVLIIIILFLSLGGCSSKNTDNTNDTPIEEIKVYATSLTLSKPSVNLVLGGSEVLVVSVYPRNSTEDLNWLSSDEAVATVDPSGLVTARSIGTAIITVRTPSGTNTSCTVNVIDPAFAGTGLTLDKTSLTLKEKETATLTANVSNETLRWESSNAGVATVDQTGKITAIAPGTAVITAIAIGDYKATCNVEVAKPVEAKLTLSSTSLEVTVGKTKTLKATLEPKGDDEVFFSSSDSYIAEVNNKGVITGVTAGTATITVSSTNGLEKTCKVKVVAKKQSSGGSSGGGTTTQPEQQQQQQQQQQQPASIKINEQNFSLFVDESVAPTVTITNESAANITWSSNNPSVAAVSSTGRITGKAPGNATITAKLPNGMYATVGVTVSKKDIPITSIKVNKEVLNITEGTSEYITFTVSPSTTTNKVYLTNSNTRYVTIDKSEVSSLNSSEIKIKVTAATLGSYTKTQTAYIIATAASGVQATCTVNVVKKEIPATSITINNEKCRAGADGITIKPGGYYYLSKKITPTNTTDTVTWASSNTSVATVEDGRIIGVKKGYTIITVATTSGKVDSCIVYVKE